MFLIIVDILTLTFVSRKIYFIANECKPFKDIKNYRKIIEISCKDLMKSFTNRLISLIAEIDCLGNFYYKLYLSY